MCRLVCSDWSHKQSTETNRQACSIFIKYIKNPINSLQIFWRNTNPNELKPNQTNCTITRRCNSKKHEHQSGTHPAALTENVSQLVRSCKQSEIKGGQVQPRITGGKDRKISNTNCTQTVGHGPLCIIMFVQRWEYFLGFWKIIQK